eukprot:TRINITY_DN8012_c0_g1_i1.p1 TRINITY_DN8012_c0_g1~~TRINITY_DN8012_c0_g1_i1.p1  ORF type:complete len:247 (-),score=24.81 TRINITY_DN8012_c0_g1_i1:165-905(-)
MSDPSASPSEERGGPHTVHRPIELLIRPKRPSEIASAPAGVLLEWTAKKPAGPKTSVVRNGRNVVHQAWVDNSETVEEYDVLTQKLLVRKHRRPTALGGEGVWVYEVGHETKAFCPERDALAPSTSQPLFTRCDTDTHFEWRVRNCPWPLSVYSVSLETVEPPVVVIRTANRKYFKRFPIPDLARCGAKGSPLELSHAHENNTLVVRYKKPSAAVDFERREREEAGRLAKTRPTGGETAEKPCAQQ